MTHATDAIHRLQAFERGHALATASTLPWPRTERTNALILAFVRMGGEHMPWGFAVGHPGETPTIVSVPEPRNVTAVADLMLALAPALLAHVGHPSTLTSAAPASDGEPRVAPRMAARQLWLGGAGHLEMLHLIDYRFTRARQGDPERVATLRAVGRACGWLFREAGRPGQLRVMDATQRLREVFAFPADDARQQHLGLLLALLGERGTRDERFASADRAEAQSIGITLAPELEREVLEGALDRYHADADRKRRDAADVIERTLRTELARRWALTEEAYERLANDARESNPYVRSLVDAGQHEWAGQYWRVEAGLEAETEPFVPDAETDDLSAAAAARYFAHLESAENARAELVHGDATLLRDAVDTGDAFEGTIRRVVDVGPGRAMLAHWTIDASNASPLRLRIGSDVAVAGMPKRTATIVDIVAAAGGRTITVEITGWKTARKAENVPAADDARALEGTPVTMVAAGVSGLSQRKSRAAWERSGPGAWLTHGAGTPVSDPARLVRPDLVDLVEGLYRTAAG